VSPKAMPAQSRADEAESRRPLAECVAATDRLCTLLEEHLAAQCLAASPPASPKASPRRLCAGSPKHFGGIGGGGFGGGAGWAHGASAGATDVDRFRPWLPGAVERCLFGRVGGAIWQLYESRCLALDSKFARRAKVLSAHPDAALLADLEVGAEFAGLRRRKGDGKEADSPGNQSTAAPSQATFTPVSRQDSLMSCSSMGSGKSVALSTGTGAASSGARAGASAGSLGGPSSSPQPQTPKHKLANFFPAAPCAFTDGLYMRAAASLSKVEASLGSARGCAPREALEALESAQLEMKTDALEASDGRAELISMDDIMPIFVFVLIRSSLRRPFACARLLRDSLTPDERLEGEGRAVLLLESAATIVAFFDWTVVNFGTAATVEEELPRVPGEQEMSINAYSM